MINPIRFHHIFIILNRIFIQMIPLKNFQIRTMRPIYLKRYVHDIVTRQQIIWRKKLLANRTIVYLVTAYYIFLIRTIFTVLVQNDYSIFNTLLGSQFHHMGMIRFHPEMVALHIGAREPLLTYFMFRSITDYTAFQMIIAYCHQIFNPYLSEEENTKRENSIRYSHMLGLTYPIMKRLKRIIRILFKIQCFSLLLFPISLALTGWRIFYSIDPYRNNFFLFNYSYYLFYFYCFFIPAIIACSCYIGWLVYSNLMIYYCITSLILRQKAIRNKLYLKKWYLNDDDDNFYNHLFILIIF